MHGTAESAGWRWREAEVFGVPRHFHCHLLPDYGGNGTPSREAFGPVDPLPGTSACAIRSGVEAPLCANPGWSLDKLGTTLGFNRERRCGLLTAEHPGPPPP